MKKIFVFGFSCLLLAAFISCSNDGGSPATQQTPVPEIHTESTNFLDDWETMEFLYINDTNTLDTKIEAPWNTVSAPTRIPESIRFDVKKADGWEVAFNLMNKDGRPDANYFGLYNKYTGVLRFFYYYNKEVASSATDFAFDIVLGVDGKANPAYYSTLNFGIPMDADVNPSVNLLGEGGDNTTFRHLITPYSCVNKNTMIQGWYAFDVDMSAYTGKRFCTDGSGIQIGCRAGSKTSVSLGTDISGKLGGNINLKAAQASSYKASEKLSDISSLVSNVGETLDAIGKAVTSEAGAGRVLGILSAVARAGSNGLQIASIVTKSKEHEQPEMTGKIDLTLTATANTKGYLETELSTNVKNLTVEKAAFNPDSNIGKGVWNIDKSPEIYFISDKIITALIEDNWVYGESTFLNYVSSTDGGPTYLLPRYECRFPYFYDPSSFNVKINTEVFPDASNVQVLSYCGIYERDGNKTQNTNLREALGIGDLKTKGLDLPAPTKETSTVKEYKDLKGFIVDCSKEKYSEGDLKFGGLSYKSYGEAKDYHYYGQELGSGGALNFILEPQIYYAEQHKEEVSMHVYVPTRLPELYVVVCVMFESGGKTFCYSRTYLPKVSEVSYEDAKTIVAGIKTRLDQQTDKVYRDEYKTSLDKKMEFLKTE